MTAWWSISALNITTLWIRRPLLSAPSTIWATPKPCLLRRASTAPSHGKGATIASPAEDFRNTFPAPFTHVAVIGAGYVGLPMALHVANSGVRVTAVDTNETVVREINERTSKVEEKEDFEKFFGNPWSSTTCRRGPRRWRPMRSSDRK